MGRIESRSNSRQREDGVYPIDPEALRCRLLVYPMCLPSLPVTPAIR